MPDEISSADRVWRAKPDTSTADPATRNEQQISAQFAAAAAERAAIIAAATADRLALAQLIPLSLIRPAAGTGWSIWDLDATRMTNPDIAANNWNITLTHSPFTALTRAGDVRWQDHLWAAAASGHTPGVTPNYPPAAGTYYSTLVAGRLLLQLPIDVDVSIWRTISNAWLYSADVGGGVTQSMRMLYLSNGAVGSTNVTAGWVNDTAQGVTAVAGALSVVHAAVGSPAVHLALEAYASQMGHATGRYIRAGMRPLFGNGACAHNTGAIIDTGHGNGVLPNTARCGLRLMNGPSGGYNSYLGGPIEIFNIRRRPHRQDAFF